MPMIQFQLILKTLSIFKKVQTISVDGGDYNVDPTSTSNFHIPWLGSSKAKQRKFKYSRINNGYLDLGCWRWSGPHS